MRPKGSQRDLEKRRIAAVDLLLKGWAPAEVANKFSCSKKSVLRWQQTFIQKGRAGLDAKLVAGRPSKLNPKIARNILQSLSAEQRTAGQLTDEIRNQSGVSYHRRYIKRLVKRLGITLCSILCLQSSSRATGVTGASFLRTEQSARVVGMGGTFVALADDGDAVYWNPGGLGLLRSRSFRLTHHQGIIDIRENFLAAIYPFGRAGTLGLDLLYSTIADVNIYDDFGIIIEEAENYDFVANAAWGFRIRGHTGIGVGMKAFTSRLAEAKAAGIAFDLGFLSHPPLLQGSSIGLAVQNIGPGITYISESDPLPLNLRAGFSYQRSFAANHGIRASIEVSRILYKYNLVYPTIGMEYDFRKNYFFRAGYRFNRSKDKFSVGLGLSSGGFQLDYAFLPFGLLGASHRFTLGLNLGEPSPKKKTPVPSPTPTPQPTVQMPPPSTPQPLPTPVQARYEYKFQLPGSSIFQSGDAALSQDGKLALADTLRIVQQRYAGSQILIAGYTDNRPPGSASPFASNYELSLARAKAVQNLFIQLGHPASFISVVGFGEARPRESNDTSLGRRLNRRVEIFIFEHKRQMVNELMQEGLNLFREEDFLHALYVLLKVAELDPNDPNVFRALGICYYRLGDATRTVEAFERALQLNPTDEDLKLWLDQVKRR